MAIGRAVRDTETDPFYDMSFNMLIAFVFSWLLPASNDKVEIKLTDLPRAQLPEK